MKTQKASLDMRTISKMQRSQDMKAELRVYMEEHAPELLGNKYRNSRILECCNILRFVKSSDGSKKLDRANFCKYDKFCLACSTRRAIKKIQHFEKGIVKYKLQNKNRYHITLTIRHNKSQSLEHNMDRLMEYKKIITQRVRNSYRPDQQKNSFFSQFDGMVLSIEVTHGKNWWHPHIHMLVCTDQEVDIEYSKNLRTNSCRELMRERLSITKDSHCVAMRKVDVTKNNFDRQWIAEVFKYAVKFSSLSIPHLVELIKLQKKRQYRFYSTTGIFRWWKKDSSKQKKKISQKERSHAWVLLYENYVFDPEWEVYNLTDPRDIILE